MGSASLILSPQFATPQVNYKFLSTLPQVTAKWVFSKNATASPQSKF